MKLSTSSSQAPQKDTFSGFLTGVFSRGILFSTRKIVRKYTAFTCICFALSLHPISAEETNWFDLSLEQLLEVEIFSASRMPEAYFRSPSAISVLSEKDLESSAAHGLMDALRLAAGVQVFSVSNGRWILGIRGFESNHSNQTLVLKDGRSLNIPTLNGIHWSELDYPIDEMAQVEIVRGPGGSVWGANAVNGVINIVSKPARETQGGLLSAGAGSVLQTQYHARYGGQIGSGHTHYRVYGGGSRMGPSISVDDRVFNDSVETMRGGFRLDTESSDRDTILSFQGEVFHQMFMERFFLVDPGATAGRWREIENLNTGISLVGKLDHFRSFDEQIQFIAYYEYYNREMVSLIHSRTHVGDVQYAHTRSLTERHNLTWTAEYRVIYEEIEDSFVFVFPEKNKLRNLLTSSVQHEFAWIPDRLNLISTFKTEYHTDSNFQYLGSVRVAFTPESSSTYWASVARGVRNPSRIEHEAEIRLPLTIQPGLEWVSIIASNEELKPENSLAWQFGARHLIAEKFLTDISLFYTDYSRLINADEVTGPTLTYDVPTFTGTFQNNRKGNTWGGEFSFEWKPSSTWKLSGNLSWMRFNLEETPATNAIENTRVFANLISTWQMNHNLEWNTILRRVGKVESNNLEFPGYTELDTRLILKVSSDFDLVLTARNLLNRSHQEYEFYYTRFESTWVERSIFLEGRLRF